MLTQLLNVVPPEVMSVSYPWSLSQPVGLSNARHPATTNGNRNPQIPILHSPLCHGTKTSSFTSLPSFSSSMCVSANHSLLSNAQPAAQRPKLVPIFTNKSLSRHVNVTNFLAEKKQQKQEEAQSASSARAVVKRLSCSPSSSAPLNPRVCLFFKDGKKKRNVRTTAPAQPVFQTQSAAMTEIKTRVRKRHHCVPHNHGSKTADSKY